MDRLKRHGAWLLLAVFLIGGVMGPVVHTIQHRVLEAATEMVPTAHADDGVVAVGEAPSTELAHAADCLVCTARLVLDRSVHTPVPRPGQEVITWTPFLDTIVSLRSVERLLIRGPPVVA